MATLGKPAIPTPNALDLRALQTAISNTRQRIEALEAQLGIASSMAQTTSSTTTTNLNSILTQLSVLAARIAVLENATTTDVATFTAGESITIGQCVVPIGPNNVGVADPNDTTRMFGVVGVAISNAAAAGAAVQVQRRGVFAIPGATSFSAGHAVYVDTFGAITQTPDYDATAVPIGLAVSGSQIFIAPDWPALLQPTFSSGIEDSFEAYLPVTYRAMLNALSLEAQIAALPFNSGASLDMEVPVVIAGVALRVTVGDIVALASGGGGGTVTSVALTSTGGSIVITGTNPITGSGTINLEAVSGTWKQEVRARTTGALPANTYNNGASGVGATLTGNSNGALAAQDGVTPVANDALLVMNEATGANNGIYLLTVLGTSLTPYVLTRRTDADSGAELVDAIVPVSEGTLYANTQWENMTPAPITVGTTSLVWVAPSSGAVTFNVQTASYTIQASDCNNNTWIRMNVAAPNNLTVPPDSAVSAAPGTVILFDQLGAGITTVVAGVGATVNQSRTLALSARYACGGLIKTEFANTWDAFGDFT